MQGEGAGATVGSAFGSIGLASLRDLRWRTRRFVVAAIATGLVFAVALMGSGIANSFRVEIRDTVAALGAQTWLVPRGSPGPFTDTATFPISRAARVAGAPGRGRPHQCSWATRSPADRWVRRT